MKKIPLLPNVITAFGLSCGVFVIFKMNMTGLGEVSQELLKIVTGILLLAVFADLLDGAVARAMKAESEFGGLFDSLADAVSFGIAPPVIILKSLSMRSGTGLSFLLMTAGIVYAVCGVLRLVRFNVTNQQIGDNQELLIASRKNFTGLPIPGAAAAALSGNLFLESPELNYFVSVEENTKAWILIFAMFLLGYLMISRWKFPSLKNLHIRVASFKVVLLTAAITVLLFSGFILHFAVAFFILSWGYVIVAAILSLIRKIKGKQSSTLEDFEPEPEDIEE